MRRIEENVELSKQQEKKIDELLSKMTVEEKIGQLQQCGPSLVGAFDVDFEELVNMVYDGRISGAEFQKLMSTAKQDFHEEDLRAGKIGSYNGITDAKVINRLQKIAVEETRLGIPLLFGYDVVHGYRTVTPIPLGESCAWDPGLWEETARMSAAEAAAGGIHMTFAPMVDVAKDARWGRISEGAGEDSLLNAAYGEAKVRGFQGKDLKEPDTLAACVKHFAGYGAVESGRDYNRVDMSMQRLYEEYLEPYRACVEAGVSAVMPAFNDINGVPCTVNEWLLQDVLRKDWKFNGMTVSDANAIAECVEHGIVGDRKDAAANALHAGVDMDMTSDCYSENLEALIRSGKVAETDLDRAVTNILRTKMKLGLFEHPYRTDEEKEKCMILKPEFRELALRSAEESIVLLKNESVLPLRKDTRIGIVGELAGLRMEMTGTWAIKANGEDCISILDACEIQKRNYVAYTEEEVLSSDSLEKLFAECDVIAAVVGERKNESGEAASRTNIDLSDMQKMLVQRLSELEKPLITVLFNGRPLAIGELKEQADAIVEAWHPGVEAGNAVLNILYGDVNPSGKLTTTFPYTSGQCPMYYDHINTGRPAGKSKFTSKYLDVPSEPVYPFGYGLSYTTYEYSNPEVTEEEAHVIVRARVKNTGECEGMEVVQCYFHDRTAKRVRPVKKLVDFEKIKIAAGEEKEVCFVIPKEKLGYYDMKMKFIVETGEYEFYVGGNSKDCLTCRLNLVKGK